MELRFEKILLHDTVGFFTVKVSAYFLYMPKIQKPVPKAHLSVGKLAASQYILLFGKENWKQICIGRRFLSGDRASVYIKKSWPCSRYAGSRNTARFPARSQRRNRRNLERGVRGGWGRAHRKAAGTTTGVPVSPAALQGAARRTVLIGRVEKVSRRWDASPVTRRDYK